MRNVSIVFRREFGAYFATPLAAVFLVIFVALSGAFTFFLGNFFDRNQADLQSFFAWHPWLFLILVPAVGMRLWAEERKSGTIELLMTLPIRAWEAVVGKFLAGWAFVALALALTFPIWLTVNYLGDPDNGVILASYIGSLLMAGGFLALAGCLSALTKNQVVAFIIAATGGFIFLMTGLELVQATMRAWAPPVLLDLIASLSFLTQFELVVKGVLELPSVFFFLSLIALCLFANTALVQLKKAA